MEELHMLLENFWILRDENREDYYRIRDAQGRIKLFIEEKLGYRLVINPHMAKLEKVPGEAEAWMGIQDFKESMDYAFLCLLLAFLEEKGPEEQFVLSNITEYIQATYEGYEKVDWNLFSHRRSLVRVLVFAEKIGILKVNDGEQERFSEDRTTEVLYENTGISGYFLRSFGRELGDDINPDTLLEGEWLTGDTERGSFRRHRVYRKLLLSPAVYSQGPDDQDFLYIKNYRNTIQRDFEENLGTKLHIHKNSAFLIYENSSRDKSFFPDGSNISDIILQIGGLLRKKLDEEKLHVKPDDTIEIPESEFHHIIMECRDLYKSGWYKSYRELSPDKLIQEVMDAMESWKMIVRDKKLRSVKILPMVGKFTGEYPENFVKGVKTHEE